MYPNKTMIPTEKTSVVLLGWSGEPWDNGFPPEFKAPANYKKEETIQAYIANKKEELKEKAKFTPFHGRITDWVLFGVNDEKELRMKDFDERFVESTEGNIRPSLKLFWALSQYHCHLQEGGELLVRGFNADTAIQMAHVERVREQSSKGVFGFPPSCPRAFGQDPLRDLFRDISPAPSVETICKFLGLTIPNDEGLVRDWDPEEQLVALKKIQKLL